jgi:hypothetical protein
VGLRGIAIAVPLPCSFDVKRVDARSYRRMISDDEQGDPDNRSWCVFRFPSPRIATDNEFAIWRAPGNDSPGQRKYLFDGQGS